MRCYFDVRDGDQLTLLICGHSSRSFAASSIEIETADRHSQLEAAALGL
jgi:hypothetical protein